MAKIDVSSYADIERLSALADDVAAGNKPWERDDQQRQNGLVGVRKVEYRGHKIEIETRYRITIDGKDFHGHAGVDEDGHLMCHAIPYDRFASAVDMVKLLVDLYPDDFAEAAHSDHGGHS